MLKTFADKETEIFWKSGKSKKLPPSLHRRALDKLQLLDAAEDPRQMSIPLGNRLKKLSGDLAGFWSVRINDQWRILFRFEGKDAVEVAIMDYH